MAPASTTVWASSGECLLMSDRAEAAMRFNDSSGSCRSHDIIIIIIIILYSNKSTKVLLDRYSEHM